MRAATSTPSLDTVLQDVARSGINGYEPLGIGPAQIDQLGAFGEDPAQRVLFSTDAGGLGLNLQGAASIVVNLEVPWNPAVLEQRIGRVHRLGQRRSVQVLHFVTRGAIEERVRMVVEGKRALFEGLLSDDADQISMDAEGRASFLECVTYLFSSNDGRCANSPRLKQNARVPKIRSASIRWPMTSRMLHLYPGA